MLKGIMAVDDCGGVSKSGSMPWPKNTNDLQWFKKNTLNHLVIMGRLTWIDPMMPAPLKNRVNVLITRKSPSLFPGADKYVSGNLINNITNIINEFNKLEKWVIGGPNIVDQLFGLIDEFYLTHVYGNFHCDKKINLKKIYNTMKLEKKIKSDDNSCHFEIWKR